MKTMSYTPAAFDDVVSRVKSIPKSSLSKHINVKVKAGSKGSVCMDISALSVKAFREYKEATKRVDRQLSVVGQTKLKQTTKGEAEKSKKTDALLAVSDGVGATDYFEVRERYKFSRVKGYLPVGNDQFVAVIALNPLYIIVPLIILAGVIVVICLMNRPQPDTPVINRYIEEIDTSETVNTDSAKTRYRLNTTLTVVQNTIQNLNFENVNKDKYVRVKIKLDHDKDTDYIYDSELIPYGKKVTSDTLLTTDVPKGTYHTIAECYVYNMEKEQLAQTNFKITLIVK